MTPGKAAEVNSLCARCLRSCRQSAAITLVECRRFLPRPFKIAEHRYDQLDLFGAAAEAQPNAKAVNAKAQGGKERRKEVPGDPS